MTSAQTFHADVKCWMYRKAWAFIPWLLEESKLLFSWTVIAGPPFKIAHVQENMTLEDTILHKAKNVWASPGLFWACLLSFLSLSLCPSLPSSPLFPLFLLSFPPFFLFFQ